MDLQKIDINLMLENITKDFPNAKKMLDVTSKLKLIDSKTNEDYLLIKNGNNIERVFILLIQMIRENMRNDEKLNIDALSVRIGIGKETLTMLIEDALKIK